MFQVQRAGISPHYHTLAARYDRHPACQENGGELLHQRWFRLAAESLSCHLRVLEPGPASKSLYKILAWNYPPQIMVARRLECVVRPQADEAARCCCARNHSVESGVCAVYGSE